MAATARDSWIQLSSIIILLLVVPYFSLVLLLFQGPCTQQKQVFQGLSRAHKCSLNHQNPFNVRWDMGELLCKKWWSWQAQRLFILSEKSCVSELTWFAVSLISSCTHLSPGGLIANRSSQGAWSTIGAEASEGTSTGRSRQGLVGQGSPWLWGRHSAGSAAGYKTDQENERHCRLPEGTVGAVVYHFNPLLTHCGLLMPFGNIDLG